MRRNARQKQAIENLNIEELVRECKGVIRAALRNPEISDLDKAKISVPIITKHMVNKVEGEIKQDTILYFSWGTPEDAK